MASLWTASEAHITEMVRRYRSTEMYTENLKIRNLVEDVGIDARTILKCNLKK
jgi:hypothetical protein